MRTALIDAAAKLFADRGPPESSVRDVAEAAGVNHGLVHRHFGSKDGLLRAVMQHLADEVAGAMGPVDPDEGLRAALAAGMRSTEAGDRHWRILSRLLLDGVDPGELQGGYPTLSRLLEAARRDPSLKGIGPDPETRVVVATVYAMGMLLFGPFARAALDLPDDRWTEIRRQCDRLIAASLMSGDAPGQG